MTVPFQGEFIFRELKLDSLTSRLRLGIPQNMIFTHDHLELL